jgi:molybdate transport system substrate-binding protein
MRSLKLLALAFLALLALRAAPAAAAEEVRVMTSGGFTAAYDLLRPEFEKATGITVHSAYGASGGGAPDSIPVRLTRGEPADLLILSREALDLLTREGRVVAASRIDLVRSKIGVAVRAGAPKPDISTRAGLIAALKNARSIGYSASASGTYLAEDLFPRLGVWEEIKGKSVRILSERVAAVVARGEVEIGFQQISEILPVAGADYAGPLPEELQEVTVFSAGITTSARNPAGARRLIDYLSSRAVAPTVAGTGLDPVALDRTN